MNMLLSLYKAAVWKTAESTDVARRVAGGSGVPHRARISSNLAQRLHELCFKMHYNIPFLDKSTRDNFLGERLNQFPRTRPFSGVTEGRTAPGNSIQWHYQKSLHFVRTITKHFLMKNIGDIMTPLRAFNTPNFIMTSLYECSPIARILATPVAESKRLWLKSKLRTTM